MKTLRFDFNNLFAEAIGPDHGAGNSDFAAMIPAVRKARGHLTSVISSREDRVGLGLEWTQLWRQGPKELDRIQQLGTEIAENYSNVLFLGIGGSYLGLKAAQDALAGAYYNEFSQVRDGLPRVYFEGNNLDPLTLDVLLKNLDPTQTFVVVISKSGETTETKAAFTVVEAWLKRASGSAYGRQIVAITDPVSGSLRTKVDEAQARDALSFRSLPLLKGVGGRYSELNMGLLHLALIGVDIREVLAGAGAMFTRCVSPVIRRNPAAMYAALHTLLFRDKGKNIGIIMPFGEGLKSTADWYCQLLAESTGKKYAREVSRSRGREQWLASGRVVNTGRTPISTRGTNDLHSVQQNNIEGRNDKVVTFIRVEKFREDILIPGKNDILAGKSFSRLLSLAQEATEWALTREQRPNCCVSMPELSPYHWGELLFFFEMATAFEGELLGINAFDQPGVEGYKNYMYYKLSKPGLSPAIKREIAGHPLVKRKKYIV